MKIKQVDGLQAELNAKCFVPADLVENICTNDIVGFYTDEDGARVISLERRIDDASAVSQSTLWTSEKTSTEIAKSQQQILGIVAKTTAFTLALTDAGKYIRFNSASEAACTVPPNSSVAFPVNTVITLRQIGAGQLTVSPGSGVTLNGDAKTAGQHKSLQIIKVDTDIWDIIGGVA